MYNVQKDIILKVAIKIDITRIILMAWKSSDTILNHQT